MRNIENQWFSTLFKPMRLDHSTTHPLTWGGNESSLQRSKRFGFSEYSLISMNSQWNQKGPKSTKSKPTRLRLKGPNNHNLRQETFVELVKLEMKLWTQINETSCRTRSPSRSSIKALGNPGSDTSCYRIKVTHLRQYPKIFMKFFEVFGRNRT